MNKNARTHRTSRILYGLGAILIAYLLLAIPPSTPTPPLAAASPMTRAFVWMQDARWDSLEAGFAAARKAGCEAVTPMFDQGMLHAATILARIEAGTFPPDAAGYTELETGFFSLAPLAAACPRRVPDYISLFTRMRSAVKRQSQNWDMNDRQARETLYRLIYGGRSAVEEVMLQVPRAMLPPPLVRESDEASATPAAMLLGVPIHSGDILVSRGGAPTSALIARGNDFPGNFSHIALAHVDSSGRLSIIESHIERGVAVATSAEYLADTKLRVMVLRLRADLPSTTRDPMLPHTAACAMLLRAHTEHIAYDFSMDYSDPSALFCSEVASAAYAPAGVKLWTGMSHISSPGLRAWLADFGVTHFETQEPADLEYDPQLRVVAEWRDTETLRKDHIDNAVTEAMLEAAERGDRLEYNWYMLPFARLAKAYSVVLNFCNAIGPVPEGMNAASALKHKDYSARHDAAVKKVTRRCVRFLREHGYSPPYWELLRMARGA